MSAAVELTGPRASGLAYGCPRRGYYDATDAPAREPSDQTRRWWRRGHAISDAITSEIVTELRESGQRPRREEPIPWPAKDPIGVGHADIWIARDKRIVEVTSTAGADLQAHKARQAALYALEHPRAEEAFVLAIDPQSYQERWYPIDVAALAPEVLELEQELVSGLRRGVPPARRCQRPSDAETYRCPYADHCFADWTPEYPDALLDPEIIDLVDVLADADVKVRRAKKLVDRREERRNALRDQLRPLVPAGEALACGERILKRSVSTQQRFSLKMMAAAGHPLPSDLAPFVSESERETWTVK